jgi:aspartyl-tRNA(Asn)/glutamyl-tRNA(Gln) amidotransferase subunit C
MPLSAADVQKIANLARIELSDAELAQSQTQLNAIFSLIEAMQAADTQGIEPMAHAQDTAQRLRDDAVSFADPDGARRDRFLQNAPATAQGLYLVPKVIE